MRILGLMLILLTGVPALAGPDRTHTAIFGSAHFDVRYRVGSRAGALVESTAAEAERALERICALLGVKNDGRYQLYLYDHVAELAAINKLDGVGGFAASNQIHVPIKNLQTLAHEIAHVVTYRLPKSGDEPRNLFFPDGISNALLAYVHGVPVHAVAKYYRARKRLPRLAEMTGAADFYAWSRARPGLNTYDIAASWMRFLIDAQGMAKTVRYYTGTSTKEAFGASLEALEKAWHEALDQFVLRPEVEALLRQRHGEPATFLEYQDGPLPLPPDLRGKDSDWKEWGTKKLTPEQKDVWTRKGASLHGVTSGTWSWCALGTQALGDAGIRATLRPAPNCLGIGVRLGPDIWGLLVQNGTFLYTRDNKPIAGTSDMRLSGTDRIELTVVRRGSRVQVFVDGHPVLDETLTGKAGVPSVGVAQGSVTLDSLRVRRL